MASCRGACCAALSRRGPDEPGAGARQADVRRGVEGLTEETLAAGTTPPDDAGWPPPRPFPDKDCLSLVLNEEWWHRTYAERDLAIFEKR